MECNEWRKQLRDRVETLYDHFAPKYWKTFGFYPNETHLKYLQMFLDQVPSGSSLLTAAYHYYPALEQVRAWVQEAGLAIEAEGTGNGYEHYLMRNRPS